MIGARIAARLALLVLAAGVGAPATAGGAASRPPDISGIWISYLPDDPDLTDIQATMARYRALPNYRPGWAERVRETWAKSARGEKIFDAQSDCLPPGLANWFQFIYPTEILITPGQITINTEYFNQTRRVFTDGRGHPSEEELDPTFLGHSIGRWEGDTLVIDTVGLRNTLVSDIRPHSEKLHVVERLRLGGRHDLEWSVMMEDPIAFQSPFRMTIDMRRAPKGEQIREMVCQESRNQEVYAPPSTDGAARTP